MSIEDLTITDNINDVSNIEFIIPFNSVLSLNAFSISVISNLLQGTDSNEWLTEANENILNYGRSRS